MGGAGLEPATPACKARAPTRALALPLAQPSPSPDSARQPRRPQPRHPNNLISASGSMMLVMAALGMLGQEGERMRRLRLACVLGLVFVLGGAGEGAFATGALGFSGYAAARSAGEWPQFHFGPNLKGSNPFETILNPTTVGGLRQAWTLTTGFEIVHSSPAVAGGVAYIGSF